MFKYTNLVAHRGYSSHAPENTHAAFMLALAHGYKDIEFDVQLTKDGIPIVIHDATVDRTTSGTGNVLDYTYENIKKLDAGSWFDKKYTGETIPSLLETLLMLRGKANLHIELKENLPNLPASVASVFASSGWLDDIYQLPRRADRRRPRLIISSYDRALLLKSIELLPSHVIHELLVEEVSDESLLWASKHNLRSYHPDGKDITPELIKKAKKLNLHIGAWWSTREEQDIRKIKGLRYAFVDAPHEHRLLSRLSAFKIKK